jgi:hypothetical protein
MGVFPHSQKMAVLFDQISTAWLCHGFGIAFCYSISQSFKMQLHEIIQEPQHKSIIQDAITCLVAVRHLQKFN